MKTFNVYTKEQFVRAIALYGFHRFDLHHTALPDHKDFNGSNHQELQNNMRDYHMNQKGFQDIAQHATVFPDGRILAGRDFNIMPASIAGNNEKGTLMVEMLGNFDVEMDVLSGKQKETVLFILYWVLHGGMQVVFHRDKMPTSCPGSSIDKATLIQEAKMLYEQKMQIPDWQVQGFKYCDDFAEFDNPQYWLDKLEQQVTYGEMFALLEKIIRKLNDDYE